MKNSRRDFVKKTLIGTAAISFGGILPGFSAKSYGRILGSNESLKAIINKEEMYFWQLNVSEIWMA